MGRVARWPLPTGVPALQSGGQNQQWPTSWPGGYIILAAWGLPNASRRGTKSPGAHFWTRWLHDPYRLGGHQSFRVGDQSSSGPQVGRVATLPLPPGGSPTLRSGGQNHQGHTFGLDGYINPTASEVTKALEWGTKVAVAHKWAGWLHNPYCLRGPQRFRAGDQISNGPQLGRVAT